jgi:hypothetical protein
MGRGEIARPIISNPASSASTTNTSYRFCYRRFSHGNTAGALNLGLWILRLDGPVAIRTRVLEVHEVTLEQLDGSTQIGATWRLADGRVWMRELRPEDV